MKKLILAAFSFMMLGVVNVKAQTLNEGFDGGTFPPNDWTFYNYSNIASEWSLNGFNPISGANVARLTGSGANHDDWMIPPKLSITSTTDSITFHARKNNVASPPTHSIKVKVSTTGRDTASFTTTIGTITPEDWVRHAFDLSAYNGQDIYVALHTTTSGNSHLYIDSMTGPTLFVPSCPSISFLDVTNITHNQAEFTWDSIANADSYTYQIFEDGTGPAGTIIATGSVTDTNIVVNGLPVATDLEIWITTDCGVTDGLSEIDGPHTFSTICGPITTTTVEDFSTYLPNCWTESQGELTLNTAFTSTSSSNWADDGFANVGFTGSAKINIYSPSFGTSERYDWLISPTIHVDSIPNSQISFFAALTDYLYPNVPDNGNFGDDDKVHVVVSTDNGLTWSDTNIVHTFDTANVPSHTGSYVSIPLDGYTGAIKIGFYAESTVDNEDNDFFIDNFKWSETPTCDIVTQINVDSLDAFNAYISWDTTSNATDFIVEYGAPGFALGTGTQITVTGALNTALINLTASTDYEVYVAPICSATDTGDFQISAVFTTECAPVTAFFTEDFTTYLPNDCWIEATQLLSGTTTITPNSPSAFGSWEQDDYLNTGSNKAAKVNIYGSFKRHWLVTESINLDSLPDAQIEFDAGITNWNSSGPDNMGSDDRVEVLISTDNGLTWLETNSLYTFTLANQPSNSGDHYSIPITTYSGNVKFAFYAESTSSNTDYDFFIDNFQISDAPSCLPTIDYTVVSVEDTTATISWGNINGVNDYILEYGVAGFALGSGTTVTVSTGTSTTLTGLDAVTTYDVYVRAICSSTDTANFLYSTSFTTECLLLSTTVLEEFNTVAPACWSEQTGQLTSNSTLTGTTSSWMADGYLNVGTTGSARSRVSGLEQYHWLISPSIYLGTQEKQIEFDAGQTGPTGTGSANFALDDTVSVVISTDDGATWSKSNALIQFHQSNPLLNTGAHYTASLADYVGLGNVKIGFYSASNITNLDINVYVDNFELKDLDTTAVDLGMVGIEVPDTFCAGELVSISALVENSGFVPVGLYPLSISINGPTVVNSLSTYITSVDVGEIDTVEMMSLNNLLPGAYTVEVNVLATGDINIMNNSFEYEFYVSDYPSVFAGSDISICYGESYVFNATGSHSYEWVGGYNNGDSVAPTTTTTYIVSGSNTAGCSSLDTVVVSVEVNAAPTILYLNQLLLTDELYLNYYWEFNGSVVGTNSTYPVTQNGIYTLVAETFSGCEVLSTYNVTGIGITEVSDFGISVHPNPVSDKLFVESDKKLENIKVFDLNGRKVIEGGLTDYSALDVSNLENGIYILYGTVEGQPFQTKFTKQ